ncbi:hypothetical protein OsI_22487 [Oryza sativa Indica Group]|uniref:Uncharacterized protein n=1 Tax=Oryza sativa subsp. indica TaxID=39946 RepID=A2YBK4_ORYSI|nr:hypothetical protein OsI_22487 [Oryza sativa Indica Group]
MFTTRVRRCRFSLYQDHVIAHPVLVVLVFLIADHHHLWASHIVGHVQTSSFDAVLCTVNVQHLQSPEKVCPPLLPLLHSLRPSASSTFCGRMGGEVGDEGVAMRSFCRSTVERGAQVQPHGGGGWGHGRSAGELAVQLREALEPRARPRDRRRLGDEADARMGRVEGVAATATSMAATLSSLPHPPCPSPVRFRCHRRRRPWLWGWRWTSRRKRRSLWRRRRRAAGVRPVSRRRYLPSACVKAHRVWMRRCWAFVDARWQVVTDDEGLSPGPYKYLRSFSSVEDAGEGISVSLPDVPTKMVSKIHKTAKIAK